MSQLTLMQLLQKKILIGKLKFYVCGTDFKKCFNYFILFKIFHYFSCKGPTLPYVTKKISIRENKIFLVDFINILIPVYPRRGKIFKTCSNIFMFRYRAFWLFMQIVSNRYFIPYSLIKIQFLQTNNRSDIYLIPKMPLSKYSQKNIHNFSNLSFFLKIF